MVVEVAKLLSLDEAVADAYCLQLLEHFVDYAFQPHLLLLQVGQLLLQLNIHLLQFCAFPFGVPEMLLVVGEVLRLLHLIDLEQLLSEAFDLLLQAD